MSVLKNESDACTTPRTDNQNNALTHCGHKNDNPSSPPVNLNDDTTSCTCIQSGGHYLGRPNNKPPSHLVHPNGDGIYCKNYPYRPNNDPPSRPVHLDGDDTSCTSVQDDPGRPNNDPPPHPVHLDGDDTPCTSVQDDPGRPNNNPPPHPILHDRTATSCKCQNHDHYRILCGCPSEDSHIMHANGAKHHHWCSQCLLYCFRDQVCEKLLPIPVPMPPMPMLRSSDRSRVCRGVHNAPCGELRLRSRHPYGRDF